MKIRIGTRQSALALKQTELVADRIKSVFADAEIEIVKKLTSGDKNLGAALIEFGGKGAFVTEFEDALLNNQIDIAVHSAKDLPYKIAKGLKICAVLQREDAHDVLITRADVDLSKHFVVGTSSQRRKFQIERIYDCECKLLRGNVPTRLQKLKFGEYDAIILAAAGLKRLGLYESDELIYKSLDYDKMVPAGGQGIIAIECRENDSNIISILSKCNDEKTFTEFNLERYILEKLESGCHEPTAVFSCVNDEEELSIRLAREINGGFEYKYESGKVCERFNIADNLIEEKQL